MLFTPLRPQATRPVAFIQHVTDSSLTIRTFGEAQRVYRGTDAIVSGILDHCDYHLVLLNESPHDLCRCGSPELWALYAFNGQPVRVTLGDVSIYPLNGIAEDPLQLEPFYSFLDALEVRANAPSTVTRNLWRRTLLNPVELREIPGEWGRIGGRALRAGRRETRPGRYRGVVRMDLPAAFPTAMSKPLPTRLVPARPGWYECGIARAQVEAPDGEWTLLPRGERLGEGLWTYEELYAATQLGHGVLILESWRGSSLQDVFSEWYRLVCNMRMLPGASGTLSKRLSNKLWGGFALKGSRYTKTTFSADGTPLTENLSCYSDGSAAFIATLIAGRVNALLLTEGLAQGAVACDTDCVIVPLEVGARLELSGWKRKEEMTDLEIVSQQAYRYKCMRGLREHSAIDGCVGCYGDRWHYVVQGQLTDSWEAEFEYEREAKRANNVLGWKRLDRGGAFERVESAAVSQAKG